MVDSMSPSQWEAPGLARRGFNGFIPFADLQRDSIPREPGVYVVLRPHAADPRFAPTSQAGWFKDRDPTVSLESLRDAWINNAPVLYIGKAAAGARDTRGLRARIWEYRRFGFGDRVGHWGGRYIWQLEDAHELLVAWMPTPAAGPAEVEAALIDEFRETFGARPSANRVDGRTRRI